MYKNIHYDSFNSVIHLWDDIEGYKNFKFKPYAYAVDPAGEYKTIDGYKVKKVHEWTQEAVNLGLLYEHDIHPATRVLIDLYYETDSPSTDINSLFLDIEVAKEETYSTVEDAANPIISISYKSTNDNKYYCLLLDTKRPPTEYISNVDIQLKDGSTKTINCQYFTFKSEFDLLKAFLREYSIIKPDVISGWNVEWFDMPYLYNRISKVLGKDWANSLSPIKHCSVKISGAFQQTKIVIAGVSILDYLDLYKNYTYSEQANYKLNTICKKELGRGKIEYDGDLQTLYETNIEKFAMYNIIDVELILGLDEKLQLIDIARGICHKGHVPYENFTFPSKYLDGASLVYCRRQGLIASSNKAEGKNSDSEDHAQGAFVKEPEIGLHKWIYSIDIQSLYPNLIRTLNISPETKYARVIGEFIHTEFVKQNDKSYTIEFIQDNTALGKFSETGFNFKRKTFKTTTEFKSYLTDNQLSISSAGIIYDLKKPGLIPSILSLWFQERLDFKKLMSEYGAAGNKNLESFYDKQQLITKILLNSFYGVLLLKSFRFYDKENGESVTLTGQNLIKFSIDAINLYYSKYRVDNINSDVVVASDTDSLYIKALPLLNEEATIENVDQIGKTVQTFINNLISKFSVNYLLCTDSKLKFNFEKISKAALFLPRQKSMEGAKKRYALLVVSEDGKQKEKIDVKGIDVVRSNYPKAFREFTKGILQDILYEKDKDYLNKKVGEFGKLVKTTYINDIMLPTGIKDIKKWETSEKGSSYTKGTPIHVKSAINYNRMLDLLNIKSYPKISNGDKIIWCPLKKNSYGYDTIALAGESPNEIISFVNEYIDRDSLFEDTLKNKIQTFWNALKWGNIVTNNNINKFFKF